MYKILIKLIKLYQNIPGPWHNKCRHIPTCSNYALEAINEYGAFKGSILSVKRIFKCNPWGSSGYDPVPRKGDNKMKKKLIVLIFAMSFFLTGCFNDNTMENVKITTTIYPIEYITNVLYGTHAKSIISIYPDDTNINNYALNNKQLEDYSKNDMFIYNGKSIEPEYAIDLLNMNKSVKIIDAAKGMDYSYDLSELWLDPFNFLMLAQNIKDGFAEYIDDPYLNQEIQENYNKLNLQVSELDVELKEAASHAVDKTLVVSSNSFNYLSKYGFTIISLDEENNATIDKNIAVTKKMINDGTIEFIFLKKNEQISKTIKSITESTNVQTETLHTLNNLSENDRDEELDYISIMKSNIEKIRKELYK